MKEQNESNIVKMKEFKRQVCISLLNGGKKHDPTMEAKEEKLKSANHMLLEFKYNESPNRKQKRNCMFCSKLGKRKQVQTGCFQCKAAFCANCFTKCRDPVLLKSEHKKVALEAPKSLKKKPIDSKHFDASDFEGL